MKKYIFSIIVGIAFLSLCGLTAAPQASAQLTNIELLGKFVFFAEISFPPERMGCVTCHVPETGGTGGNPNVNLHQVAITGANPHTVGVVKPPTNAYASLIPPFFAPCAFGFFGVCGGNFWNGRAEGNASPVFPFGATKHIGNEIFYTTNGTYIPSLQAYAAYFGATADQALNPFPNPVEQNIPRQNVCWDVASAPYAPLYKMVWGVPIDCSNTPVARLSDDGLAEKAFDISFKRIVLAICAWQHSADLNSFSSKRDIALANQPNKQFPLNGFTDRENHGHDLFYNAIPLPFLPKNVPVGIDPTTGQVVLNNPPFPNLPVTNCSACHSDNPGIFIPGSITVPIVPPDTGVEPFQRYADNAYHNIGVPPNLEIPQTFNAAGQFNDPDAGLFGHSGNANHLGFQKTPTLRNVDKRPDKHFIKAYTHNGWFKSLESIVHFYNTALIGGTTANSFGVTQCPAGITTEKDALANNCWPAPAYNNAGIAIGLFIGDMGLTSDDERAIVAYLKTLTDYHTPEAPQLPHQGHNPCGHDGDERR